MGENVERASASMVGGENPSRSVLVAHETLGLHTRLVRDVAAPQPFIWETWRPKQLRIGGFEPVDPEGRRYLRCRPTRAVVLDVVEYPPEELGAWYAHWAGTGSAGEQGKAESIDEAKEQALDAAEGMLARECDALEARRLALRSSP